MAQMMRTSTGSSVVAPTLRTRFSWITRSSFTCIGSGRSATSSRNSVPPFAAWKKPSRSLLGAGEGALAVAEELALHQVLGDRAAVHRRRTALAPRAALRGCRRAASSLPLPDSPVMYTGACVRASLAIISRTCCMRRAVAEQRLARGARLGAAFCGSVERRLHQRAQLLQPTAAWRRSRRRRP